MPVEQHARPGKEFDLGFGFRHGALAIGARRFKRLTVVDEHARRGGIHFVAHGALDGIEIVIERGRRFRALPARHHRPPGFGQTLGIFLQIGKARVLRGAAQDVARARNQRAVRFRDHRFAERDQPRAFALVFDAPRQCDARLVRHQHEKAPGNRDVRGKPRAFLADRILHDLHENLFAFVHAIADLGRAFVVETRQIGQTSRFAGAEKPGAVETDIDEGGLHARQHALHAAQHDVADETMAVTAVGALLQRAVFETDDPFEEKLLQLAVLDKRDTNFPGSCIDQDFLIHGSHSSNNSVGTISRKCDAARPKKAYGLEERKSHHI